MKNKKGFTLAEVLVTLAAIGIVTALTIPTLIRGTSEKQVSSTLKKSVSGLNQALAMVIANDFSDASGDNTSEELRDLFAGRMYVIDTEDGPPATLTTADGLKYTFTGGTCTSAITPPEIGSAGTGCYVVVQIESKDYYLAIFDTSVAPVVDCGDVGTCNTDAFSALRD